MPPAAKTKLETLNVYVTAQAVGTEQGIPPHRWNRQNRRRRKLQRQDRAVHVLARVKLPKAPPRRGGAAPAAPTNRGEFVGDVVALLNSVYNVEVDAAKAKEDSKLNNRYKRLIFEGNGKDVQVYFYGGKLQPHEVALIFEYPKTEAKAIAREDRTGA